MLFMLVEGAQGPGSEEDLQEEGPSGIDVAMQASAAAVDSSARLAADAFKAAMKEWQDSVIAWRCGLTHEEAVCLGASATWGCAHIRLSFALLSIDNLHEAPRSRIKPISPPLPPRAHQVDATLQGARAPAL